jgi:Holliday junction DNA helicase RuvA
MIDAVTGMLVDIHEHEAIISTGGIDFACIISRNTAERLSEIAREDRDGVKIYTYLHHKEDIMDLYGFADKEERLMFFELIKVQGIGPKQAVRILSGISVSALAAALDTGNIAALTSIPGLGTKTAQKMVLSLRNRLELFTSSTSKSGSASESMPTACREILHALTEMGYDKKAAKDAVLDSYERFYHEGIDEKQLENDIFKASLIKLA